jgi:hypothetical protein
MTSDLTTASALGLDDEEIELLRKGLAEWSGPARPTREFVTAMGFDASASISEQTGSLYDAVKSGLPLARADWVRALLATEVAFASDAVGSGVEWSTTTGWSDAETIVVLRRLQRKLVRIVHPLVRTEVGHAAGSW